MKMDNEKYDEIKAGIAQIVDFHGKKQVQTVYADYPLTRMMFDLFNMLWFDKEYDDTHPAYVNGRKRVLPQTNPSWLNDLYKSGLNDSHIETALKKIAKELDLTPTQSSPN
jgi:meiotically up-regulated gene 157 (Mug157) protein